MVGIFSFFVVLVVSILVTKIATIALAHTGMSHESAKFQARSAFTGVGFTTDEAEKAVAHPVRRRILMLLMLLGNAGIVTAVTSLILSFVNPDTGTIPWYGRILLIIAGVGLLWFISTSCWFNDLLGRLINWGYKRWTQLDTRDYVDLLHLGGEYRVKELRVKSEDWLAGSSLKELNLSGEGVLVLGIRRGDGRYVGAPTKETEIKEKDLLIIYGRQETLAELDERRTGSQGERGHRQAVSKQQQVVREQEQEEKQAEEEEQDSVDKS